MVSRAEIDIIKFLPDDLLHLYTASAGQSSNEQAVMVAADYIANRIDKFECAFLCGSVARREFTVLSDIDLYIVGPDGIRTRRSQVLHCAHPIQLVELSGRSMLDLFNRGVKAADPYYIDAVAESLFLAGSSQQHSALKEKARRLRDRGPPSPQPEFLERISVSIINGYLKILKARSLDMRLIWASRVFDLIIEYLQYSTKSWVQPYEWARRLGTVPAGLVDEMVDGIGLIREDNGAQFLTTCRAFMIERGSFRWSTARPVPYATGERMSRPDEARIQTHGKAKSGA